MNAKSTAKALATGPMTALLLIWGSAVQAAVLTQQLGVESTRHFLQRSGLAEPPGVVGSMQHMTPPELISSTINNSGPACPVDPPAWTRLPLRTAQDYSDLSAEEKRAARKAIRQMERKRIAELQYWWISNLVHTNNPFAAKMVLFWQNHFTSEHRKVRHAQLMYNQHLIFQQHGLGNYRTLLRAVMQDPAMLIYLDNRSNRKNNPNENLARELLELFTLGEGHYSENDIKETARALTGYSVSKTMEFMFRRRQHDSGNKHIAGNTAAHNMDTLVDLLLKQPQTARTIVSKLWKTFISPVPDTTEVEKLSAVFRNANYEIKPLMQALFESDAFWASENRSTLIKSPAQFIADTLRVWQLDTMRPKEYIAALKNMEQQMFNPPNVKGWQGGPDWINTNTLLARDTFLKKVLRSAEDRDDKQNAMSMSSAGQNDMQVSMKTPIPNIASVENMSVAEVKNSLLGEHVPLERSDRLERPTLIQDLLAEPGWNLY